MGGDGGVVTSDNRGREKTTITDLKSINWGIIKQGLGTSQKDQSNNTGEGDVKVL